MYFMNDVMAAHCTLHFDDDEVRFNVETIDLQVVFEYRDVHRVAMWEHLISLKHQAQTSTIRPVMRRKQLV